MGRKTSELKALFSLIVSRVHAVNMMSLLVFTLSTWLESCLLGFSTKIPAFPVPIQEGHHCVWPTCKGRELFLLLDSGLSVSVTWNISAWKICLFIYLLSFDVLGFLGDSDGKESACNAGD